MRSYSSVIPNECSAILRSDVDAEREWVMARPSLYELNRDVVVIAIASLSRSSGKPPTLREVSERTGISVSTLHSYVNRMHDEGLVTWQPRSHRSVRLTAQGMELVD